MTTFDFASLDTQGPMEKAARMEVVNPITGKVQRLEDGQAVFIDLLGADSAKVRAKEREMMDARQEKMRRGKAYFSANEIESDNAEILVAATSGWNIPSMDGADFPCNEINARMLWTDARFNRVRDQARQFMQDVTNFVKA